MSHRVALARTDVTEKPSASIIRVTRKRKLVLLYGEATQRHVQLDRLKSMRIFFIVTAAITSHLTQYNCLIYSLSACLSALSIFLFVYPSKPLSYCLSYLQNGEGCLSEIIEVYVLAMFVVHRRVSNKQTPWNLGPQANYTDWPTSTC
jgi:hypothetical protein